MEKDNYTIHDILLITWRDSSHFVVQHSLEDSDFPLQIITTVGYLMLEITDRIVVARERMGDDYRGIIVIPWENVTEIEILKEIDS